MRYRVESIASIATSWAIHVTGVGSIVPVWLY